MNGASTRRRPRRARIVPPDPNARALVIEREQATLAAHRPRRRLAPRSILPGLRASTLETHPTRTRADVTRRA